MVRQLWLKRRHGMGRDGEVWGRYDAEDGSFNVAVLSDEFTDKAEWAIVMSGDGVATTDAFKTYLEQSRAISSDAKAFASAMREKATGHRQVAEIQ